MHIYIHVIILVHGVTLILALSLIHRELHTCMRQCKISGAPPCVRWQEVFKVGSAGSPKYESGTEEAF